MSYAYALEQQRQVLRLMDSRDGQMIVRALTSVDERFTEAQRADFWRFICRSLDHGETYYWSPELSGVLEAGARGLPGWTFRRELLPTFSGFMLFASPIRIHQHAAPSGPLKAISWSSVYLGDEGDFEDATRAADSHAFLIGEQTTDRLGAVVCFWVEVEDQPTQLPFGVPMTATIVPERMTFEELTRFNTPCGTEEDIRRNQKISVFAAALEFLNQTIVTAPKQQIGRSATRRLARDGWTHEPLVRVVKLRRAASQGKTTDHHGAPVEWSCQWVVRGHWRQQACGPNLSERRPVFVLPYVKGNPDAPLKAPTERVFEVVR